MKRFLAILFFVILSFAVGYISKLVQEPSMTEWYPSLLKPALTPPGIVFAIVWAVLYLLMGISAGLVWNVRSIYTWLVLLVFFVQLGLLPPLRNQLYCNRYGICRYVQHGW